EIWEQMDGRVDGWVAGAGTGGTFTGVARYLRERNPDCYCVVVEPQGSILKGGEAGPHEVEGIGASSFIPPVLDLSLASDIIKVDDAPAFAMVRRLAGQEGILAGSSAGANVDAAVQVARKLGRGKHGHCFASGMSAIDVVFRTLAKGDHVVAGENMYGGSYRLFSKVLEKFGLEFSYVDTSKVDAVRAAIRPNTKIVFLETPTNPM